jgi:hypothetical protein
MSCGRNPVGWRLSVAVPKHRPCAVRLIAVLCVQSPCFAQLPHRGTGLALCVRPSVRTSASAALTQTLLKGMQRLGPERISSAARRICSRFGPPQVACGRRPGTAPEQAARSWHRSLHRTACSALVRSVRSVLRTRPQALRSACGQAIARLRRLCSPRRCHKACNGWVPSTSLPQHARGRRKSRQPCAPARRLSKWHRLVLRSMVHEERQVWFQR